MDPKGGKRDCRLKLFKFEEIIDIEAFISTFAKLLLRRRLRDISFRGEMKSF